MSEFVYSAEMKYDEASYRALALMQYSVFRRRQKLSFYVFAVALVLLSCSGLLSQTGSLVLLLIACWLFVSANFPAKRIADSMIRAAGGSFPSYRYLFYDENMVVSADGEQRSIGYDRFIRIFLDKKYIYLFLGPGAGMLFRASSCSSPFSVLYVDSNEPSRTARSRSTPATLNMSVHGCIFPSDSRPL